MKSESGVIKMNQKALFIIFGGTGDLAYRKLYPALFNLYEKGYLKEDFAVIGTARRPWSNDHYHEVVMSAIEDAGRDSGRTNDDLPRKFASHFYYQSHNVDDVDHYVALRKLADELDEKYDLQGNRIFYLAMAPRFFGTIAGHLKDQALLTKGNGFNRLIIEKPFGRDYPSAKELNDSISGSFKEEQIFRIDHYLGKEPIQSIAGLRFGNALFNSLWNKEHIDNIQITLSESLGVEERAGYYETAGAMRDMVQNHIMQIVSLLTMERPDVFDSEHLRDKKIEALENIQMYTKEEAKKYFIRGQYGADEANTQLGYRDEEGTDNQSTVETFVAGKLITHNPSLDGVPVYIRTGKRLTKKSTQINIVFKNDDQNIFAKDASEKLKTNVLTMHIEPDQGFTLEFNTKTGNQGYNLSPVHLRYRKTATEKAQIPDAYEGLIRDALMGNKTNFAHWHEVSQAWKIMDVVREAWDEEEPTFPNYASGSMGPEAAMQLLADDGRKWVFNPRS
ncbi:Glucose-6-phosphate 1-dehydrogenase [Pediococcus pentosaceus]|nr:Glucose-6-phosphate 1-dehydrogenase [Pediococcus pentosaceus]QHM67615.1 Glucose-6-phosphate 1-dehydrogenase [Pediococcus pentosaceus]QHM68231.1 Glucose-6-phosphate 1-dehydrogenase [Pediococcus pentosaceus]